MISEELKCLIENRETLEKEHSGKYIALYQGKIVATGKTIHEVYASVEKLTIKNPLVTYVPKEGEEALLI
jgi:hypothetical protein